MNCRQVKIKVFQPSRYGGIAFIFIVFWMSRVSGQDDKALESMSNGVLARDKNEWRDSAKCFMEAELFAVDPVRKANALKQAAASYRKADLLYKEYTCLKKLIDAYPDQVKFERVIEREYEIGNAFSSGYRECPYTWFPWLEDDDKTIDIYETLITQAPFAKFIPEMMLKMGEYYTGKAQYKKAEQIYFKIIKMYPFSEHAPTAYLELGHLKVELSRNGDGDGSIVHDAKQSLDEYLKKYPKSSERPWAVEAVEKADDNLSRNLYELACYYHKNNNDDAAKRYIREIIVNYPKTSCAEKADKLLSRIDVWRYPNDNLKYEEKQFKTSELPEAEEEILDDSVQDKTKWMIPLSDLDVDNINDVKIDQKDIKEDY